MTRRFLRAAALAVGLGLGAARPVAAADLFSLFATENFLGSTAQRGYNSIDGLGNALTSQSLASLFPTYSGSEGVLAQLNFRGVQGFALFPTEQPELFISIARAGITLQFAGSTRDESAAQFRAWLLGQAGTLNDLIARTAVRTTPVDPVAGNPTSLLGQMVAADFNRALGAALGMRFGMGLGVGLGFGQFNARGGIRTNATTIPINWTFELSPQDELEIDAPITWIETGGANAYTGQLGLMWRRQMNPDWILQPALRIGGVNSNDFGTSSGLYQFGITSTYRFALPWNLRMIVANQISHAATFTVGIGEYHTNYAQTNTMFRNGIALTRSLGMEVWGQALQATVFAIDTRYAGDPVYIRNYQEFGAFLGAGSYSRAQAGFTILTGDRGTRGFSLRAAWQF